MRTAGMQHARRPGAAVSLLIATALVFGSCTSSDKPPAKNGLHPTGHPLTLTDALKRRFDDALALTMRLLNAPEIVAGVLTAGDDRWVAAKGIANVERETAATSNDHFGIRDVTTSFTVTAVLELVDAGKVGLDDPVAKYVDGVPGGDQITVRELANMTSGLVDYTQVGSFQDSVNADPTHVWTDRELIAPALASPPKFPAGTQYDYSRTNAVLLGLVIEKVTGRPFTSVLQNQIIGRLGLGGTHYLPDPAVLAPVAVPYQIDLDTDVAQPFDVSFTAFGPAGGMTSRLDNLLQWGRVLGTGSLLKKKTQAARLVAHVATSGSDYATYGLGIGTISGWLGYAGAGFGYATAVFFEPKTATTFAAFVNVQSDKNAAVVLFLNVAAAIAAAH
jgi:D-alanyl-D-alanine carboxypeptidase